MQVPENTNDPVKMLEEWYKLNQNLKELRTKEMAMRKMLFDKFFPHPKEGTNTHKLPDGYAVKGKYELTRNVDDGAFKAMEPKLREMGVATELLVKYSPSLAKSVYNKLTDEQLEIFEDALITKPGSPALEVVKPKR